jgi:hypothetical protein
MTSPCRGCKRSGRVGTNELKAKAHMEALGPLKALEEMSDADIVEECATWMALKNGGAKDEATQTLGSLPVSHVKVMLEKLRSGT